MKTESFCMPVVKGSEFVIAREGIDQTITGSAFWIPMKPSHRLQTLVFFNPNELSQASTNGILIGFLSQEDQGWAPGQPQIPFPSILTIQTASTKEFTSPHTVGVATVQNLRGCKQAIKYNSATAVIAKGSWFRVSMQTLNSGLPTGQIAPSARVSWVGIDTAGS